MFGGQFLHLFIYQCLDLRTYFSKSQLKRSSSIRDRVFKWRNTEKYLSFKHNLEQENTNSISKKIHFYCKVSMESCFIKKIIFNRHQHRQVSACKNNETNSQTLFILTANQYRYKLQRHFKLLSGWNKTPFYHLSLCKQTDDIFSLNTKTTTTNLRMYMLNVNVLKTPCHELYRSWIRVNI